jgi:hypothetical protein
MTNVKNYENILKNKNIKIYRSFGLTKIIDSDITSSLEINGSLTFDFLIVYNKAIIYGSIYGKHGKFHNLTVYGDVELYNSTIDNLYIIAPTVKPIIFLIIVL